MKHFTYKVRQQAMCALFVAAGTMAFTSNSVQADELDEAVAKMKASPEAPIVDRSIIFKRQPIRGVEMSPDGTKIAYRVIKGRRDEVWVHDIATSTRKKLLTSKDVERISWASDNRHIFVRTRKNVSVLPLAEGALAQIVINLNSENDEFYYGVDEKHPHAFFVSLKSLEDNSYGLYRVFPDGTKEEFYRSEKLVADFLAVPHKGMSLIKRNSAGLTSQISKVIDGREVPFYTCEFRDPCRFISAPDGEDFFYIEARFDADLASLYKVYFETGETELVHSDPKGIYDIEETILDQRTSKPFLVSYRDDYTTTYGLDAEAQDVVDILTSRLDENFYEIITNKDRKQWMLFGISATHSAPKFYLYDKDTQAITRPLKEHLDDIYAEDPRMEEAHIGARVAVSYQVRDGMTQYGYVTLPRGLDPAEVPLVVFPHGGPWSRDHGAYKSQAAFLANRGYAVFEPAFRASTGYGFKYVMAAERDFGKGRVHQDIMDGMEYVLSRGIGDRNKLAIAGHSFGGFSTVGALAFEPDTFKVGFAGAPPVDLVAAVRFLSKRAKSDRELRRLARLEYLSADPDIEGQTEELYSKSPAAYADKVTKPMYLWAGEKDDRVSILNVRSYALKQREAGKPISLMVEPRAGHSPRKPLHREAYFYMLEKALHDHVGGRMQTEISKNLRKYLEKSLAIDVNNVLEE